MLFVDELMGNFDEGMCDGIFDLFEELCVEGIMMIVVMYDLVVVWCVMRWFCLIKGVV